MKILCFGSLNIDRVYQVDHFVTAGETILSQGFRLFPGGKGLNQCIALAKAGGQAYHAGCIGPDGAFLLEELVKAGADAALVKTTATSTGHAIIQVHSEGQNCIIVSHGANGEISREQIDSTLAQFNRGDILLLQNEINLLPYLMEKAHEKGLWIVLNPSPVTPELEACPLEHVNLFILNEIEGAHLSGESDSTAILAALHRRFPGAEVLMTLGGDGSLYSGGELELSHGIFPVPVVDTTAAGDTFCGYFVACLSRGIGPENALQYAAAAASIAVSRAGASTSIPAWAEVEAFLKERG